MVFFNKLRIHYILIQILEATMHYILGPRSILARYTNWSVVSSLESVRIDCTRSSLLHLSCNIMRSINFKTT
jgi:hypothetical protein